MWISSWSWLVGSLRITSGFENESKRPLYSLWKYFYLKRINHQLNRIEEAQDLVAEIATLYLSRNREIWITFIYLLTWTIEHGYDWLRLNTSDIFFRQCVPRPVFSLWFMGQKSNEMKPYFNSKTTGRSNCLDLFTNTSAHERWNNVLGFVYISCQGDTFLTSFRWSISFGDNSISNTWYTCVARNKTYHMKELSISTRGIETKSSLSHLWDLNTEKVSMNLMRITNVRVSPGPQFHKPLYFALPGKWARGIPYQN